MANKNELEGDIVREFFDYLLSTAKIDAPVTLVRRKNLKNYGYYSFNGDRHYIVINNAEEYEDNIKCDFLAHEWSHLLQYQRLTNAGKDDEDEHHSDLWGACYAETYRNYLKFLKEKYQL